MATTRTRRAPERRIALVRARELTPSEAAWLVALPCAALVTLLVVALGPALGELLLAPRQMEFWPEYMPLVAPEPTEQARYLLSLTAPPLLAAATIWLVRRRIRLAPELIGALVRGVQLGGMALLVACVAVQRTYRFGAPYADDEGTFDTIYFTLRTLVVAAVLALGALAVMRRAALRERAQRWLAESPTARVACSVAAVLATAVWMLHAVNTESSFEAVQSTVAYHVRFTLDETYAVLAGNGPLVDFAAQYGSLLPYAFADAMRLLGSSAGVLSLLMCALTALALLAIFDLLRRVARTTPLALVLYLPFLATSLFMMRGPLENRYSLGTLLGAFPLRYAGPLLLVWLLARNLDGARPQRVWPLFLAAGLVVLNNADFGIPALGATIAALLWSGTTVTRTRLRQLLLDAAIGSAAALAIVSLVTLAHTGSLPHLELLLRYARLFASAGFGMMPMRPLVGIALAIYLTYVAAIGLATARALQRHPDRLLTGLLAWSGVFGLGAGAYYMGRSHPEVLTNMFPAWGLSVLLLTTAVVRDHLAAAPQQRRIGAPLVACLFAVGVMACSLGQTPTPWSQIERLRVDAPRAFAPSFGERYVAQHTRRHEPVAILITMGHKIAYDLDLHDTAIYTGSPSIATEEQLAETVDALREAGGRKLFFAAPETVEAIPSWLQSHGFEQLAPESPEGASAWIDRTRD
jgi:hypothetical protein